MKLWIYTGIFGNFFVLGSFEFSEILVSLCVVQLKEKKYDLWKLKKKVQERKQNNLTNLQAWN